MMTLEQIKKVLEMANIAGLARETGVSTHNLRRIKSGDKSVPYSDIEKISKHYGS